MKTVYEEYKKHVKELLSNKLYICSIVLIAVLSYGFTITNFSIGIDDLCFDRYVTGTYILSAGRWGTTALYSILQIFSFTPFWLELIVTLLTVIMGITFTAFLKKQFLGKMENIHYIITTGILISYPILHQSFIYQSTNLSVIISNFALMIIPIIIYENFKNKKDLKIYMLTAIILPFFISMYESCCQTFILITLIIAFVEFYNSEAGEKVTKKVIEYLLLSITLLICGMSINIFISSGVKVILNYNGALMPDHSSKGVPWLNAESGAITKLLENNILNKIYNDFTNIAFVKYFIILSIIAFVIAMVKAVSEKKYMLIFCMIGIIFSNFIINILQIKILYRVDTSWSIAIAFYASLLLITINDKKLNNILSLLFCIIILFQTRQMNQYFYNDYIRYKKEANYAYDIAKEIINTCEDTTKPIVFIYDAHEGIHQNQINQDNGWSLINWSSWAFNEPGAELTKFINSLGYKFTIATNEQRQEVMNSIDNSEIEMGDNKIYETNKYIIVVCDINI